MKKAIIFLTSIFAMSILSSCLKDSITIDPEKTTNVIEFKNPATFTSPSGSIYALYTLALGNSDAAPCPVNVSYSGALVAPEDITVSITIDPAALTAYNTNQAKAFVLLPANLYTLPASVLIKKGERLSAVDIKVKTSLFGTVSTYVLPLKISAASFGLISSNFGTILINVKP